MSDYPKTLAAFFLDGPDSTIDDDALSALRGRVGGLEGISWPAARDTVAKSLVSALDVELTDILQGGWRKLSDLQAALDRASGETTLVPLLKHTIRSVHHPVVELLVGDAVVASLTFDVELTLMLEAVELEVRDGRIRAAKGGSVAGQGSIKCAGNKLVEKATPKFGIGGMTFDGSRDDSDTEEIEPVPPTMLPPVVSKAKPAVRRRMRPFQTFMILLVLAAGVGLLLYFPK